MPTCLCSCVAISPQSGGLNVWGVGGGRWGLGVSPCQPAAWNTCLAQSAPQGNDTQLVWLGCGLNRPRLCHQCSRSSRTHVNNAHTRETDWDLPDSFPIKRGITLFPLWDGHGCSNENSLDSSRRSYLQFTCGQMCWLLAAARKVVFFFLLPRLFFFFQR